MSKKYDFESITKDYRATDRDCGGAGAQIAMLTHKLHHLNKHFETNKKDHASRRGLMKMVGRRKKLLAYLLKEDPETYGKVTSGLQIRVKKS
jgi:small subunit ribosomal protein S15